jgi:molybdate/tungstate transport system ATP-binding protein
MIEIQDLHLRRGNFALRNVSLTLPNGIYAVLMGPSGCGKSSLLECIAGLVPATSGRISIGGRDITRLPAAGRGIGYVPQDGALFRGLTVRENLAFALVIRRWPQERIDARVNEVATAMGAEKLLDRGVSALSGGERQRVALGRALAFHPALLLLDEPLASLDESSREELIPVLESLRQSRECTILHVTHSPGEAARLADLRFDSQDFLHR